MSTSHEDLRRHPGHLIRRAQQVHTWLWNAEVSSEVTSPQFAVLYALRAEPDIDHAAWYMVKVVNDAPWRRNIAVRGHHTIRTEYSPAAVGRLYIARLRALERRHGVAVVSRAAA